MVPIDDRQVHFSDEKPFVPRLNNLSARVRRVRAGASPHTVRNSFSSRSTGSSRASPSACVIEFPPVQEAVRIIDGCVKKNIRGGFLWEVQSSEVKLQKGEKNNERRVKSDGKALKELVEKNNRLVTQLLRTDIPLDRRSISRLLTDVGVYIDRIYDPRKYRYPALFSLALRVENCYLEVYSPENMLLFIDDEKYQLGVGINKEVLKAWHLLKPKELAYARSHLPKTPRTEEHLQIRKAAFREEKYLTLLRDYKNSVELLSAFYYSTMEQIIVMKRYKETLFKPMSEKVIYTDQQILTLCVNLLDIVADLNHKNILHRDIKPENLFIDGLKLFVTDFGLSCDMDDAVALNECSGSLHYIPYEMLKEMAHKKRGMNTRQGDVWSAGCVIWMLLDQMNVFPWFSHLNPPSKENKYRSVNLSPVLKKIEAFHKYKPEKGMDAVRVLQGLLHPDPLKRFTAAMGADEFHKILLKLPGVETYTLHEQIPVYSEGRFKRKSKNSSKKRAQG